MPQAAAAVRRLSLALVLCAAAAPVLADEFADFRAPDYRTYTLDVRASASASGAFSNRYEVDRDGRGSGDLAALGSWQHDADRAHTAMAWQFGANGDRYHQRRDDPPYASNTRETRAREYWAASWEQRNYTHVLALNWSLRTDLERAWYQDTYAGRGMRNTAFPAESQYDDDSHADTYAVREALVLGIGHVRDATPVADARVLEDRLLKGGILARPLSRRARLALARVYALEGAFEIVRQRPRDAEWAGLERILREDGAMRDSTGGVVQALRALEPWIGASAARLPHSPLVRQRGLFAGVYASGRRAWNHYRYVTHRYYRTTLEDTTVAEDQSRFASSGSGRSDELGVGGRLEWHRPFGRVWQADVVNDVSGPIGPHKMGSTYVATAAFRGAVADRWIAGPSFRYVRETRGYRHRLEQDDWRASGGVDVTVFLEDRLGLTAYASDQQNGTPRSFDRGLSTGFELTWRFAARLTARDLMLPLAAMPAIDLPAR